jgi:hypothetical protein
VTGRTSFIPQILIVLLGAAIIFTLLTLPPKAARLPALPPTTGTVFGGYHIHSSRSDGTGTPDSIAAAAAQAGLQFIILTDHGDGTRMPDPPMYRHGVLCIDAFEVSTASGHLVGLGLNRATPFPLAGEGRDVIEDIHRFGGWAVIAHPDSPKPELAWRGFNVPYDGIEWLNDDSEWRDESLAHLAATAARYVFRSPETIVSLFQRPVRTLRRWDIVSTTRAVTGLAALDAHARGLGWSDAEPSSRNHTLLARPTYNEMFRTLTQGVVLPEPFSGTASRDQSMVLDALRQGHTFSVINAIAAPASLTFSGTQGATTAGMGERLNDLGSPVVFHAAIAGAPTSRVALLLNGSEIAAGRGSVTYSGTLAAGGYRVEGFYPGNAFPWVVSNPIHAGAGPDVLPGAETAQPTPLRLIPVPTSGEWEIEKDASSFGDVALDQQATRFSFALGPGLPVGQFAALASTLTASLSQEGFDRVQFSIRADRPMRVSVQVRLPGAGDARRWRQSVYADQTPRTVVLSLQDFLPVGAATTQRPIVAHIHSVLFVVDTLNTPTATKGTFWLSDVALGVGNTER